MNPVILYQHAVVPALAILPLKMDSLRARALVMAIGFQESKCEFRFQVGGPARSYWQFERMGGCAEILTHPATSHYIRSVLLELDFPQNADATMLHNYMAYNDILAAACARLLLWAHPKPLPSASEVEIAWQYYLEQWKPGKPHRESWDECHRRGWELVSD